MTNEWIYNISMSICIICLVLIIVLFGLIILTGKLSKVYGFILIPAGLIMIISGVIGFISTYTNGPKTDKPKMDELKMGANEPKNVIYSKLPGMNEDQEVEREGFLVEQLRRPLPNTPNQNVSQSNDDMPELPDVESSADEIPMPEPAQLKPKYNRMTPDDIEKWKQLKSESN